MGSHKIERSNPLDTRAANIHHEHRHLHRRPTQQATYELSRFENSTVPNNKFHKHHHDHIRYRDVFRNAKKNFGKPIKENHRVPWPTWETVDREEKFIKHPSFQEFLSIEQEFKATKLIAGHQKFMWIDSLLINPDDDAAQINGISKYFEMENWHHKKSEKFNKELSKAEKKSQKRHDKIENKGLGFGGKMTEKIAKAKAGSFYAKNNLTVRGNVFKLTHEACPKNIIEMTPRYGYRKSAHVGVRVGQFTINGILSAIGYALTPVTFGVSKIVSNSLATVVTLSGESITHKIEGAEKKKISMHAGLRGFQLEIPLCIPLVGNILYNGDSMLLGTAAVGIVSTTIADAILHKVSTRYTPTMNVDDLGNSRCLEELNARIDYLSKFFLPYGQYLLLKEEDPEKREKIKSVLKKRFKTLRNFEQRKVESLNFYRLALAAEKVPKHLVEKISMDVKNALPDTRINTHKIVKRCLATLIKREGAEHLLKKNKTT